MPTIAQQLSQLESDRSDLVDNLTTQGITGLTGDETFTELVPEVLNIPSGGGTSGWQRPNDWWDTETILANAENITDGGNTYYPAYIILLDDSDKQTTFSKTTTNKELRGDGYLTSDGAWYGTTDATHTWDESKDKSCSEGYKTRYVLVYTKTPATSLAINLRGFPCLEVILGNITCSPIFRENTKLRNVVASNDTQITTNSYIFYNCMFLQNIYMPNLTSFNKFAGIYSLNKVQLPNLTSMGNYPFFESAYNLQSFTMPDTITTIPTASNSFSQYLKALILPENFALDINLTGATSLTHSALVDIISKLKDLTGTEETHTITLGSTNSAKLSADEIAVATNKGWTVVTS